MMLESDQAREPAWAGLEPQSLRLRATGDAWAKRILAALGRPGRLFQREQDTRRPAAYYQFIADDGSEPLFLKTVSNQRLQSQLDANQIAAWLKQQGIPVSVMLNNFPRRLNPSHQLLAYRQIAGRFAQTMGGDMQAIGNLLGHAHNALRTLPISAEIRARSAARNAMFERMQNEARMQHTGDIAARVGTTQLPASDAQVIHGDLNIGNLLFDLSNQRPLLLDFEDANHNWHSPQVDLAMALERFVLARQASDRRALNLGSMLLDSYLQTVTPAPGHVADPVAILHALATRALLLIANTPPSASTRSESQKFLLLHQRAEQRRRLLDTLWLRLHL